MNELTLPPREMATSSLFSFLILAFLSIGCASTIQLPSRWSDQQLRVDGNLAKWSDSTAFIDKDGVRIGVMNDEEYFYLCLISSTPNIGRQLMARGMTLWFDPHGGQNKVLGVKFPIGMQGRGMMGPAFDGQSRPEPGEPDERQMEAGIEGRGREALNEFEFLGPAADDRQRVSRLQGQGLEMHLTATPERFVYELRIPLRYSSRHPYAIETSAGAAVGVGVETNSFNPRMEGEGVDGSGGSGPGGVPPGGGRPGSGGGRTGQRPGGMGPASGRLGAATPVSLNIWMRVQLAANTR